MKFLLSATAGLLAATLLSVGASQASDASFREIDCKEYHALTGYRVCAVQKKVWIRKKRYDELRIERDRKLCRAEKILTYGRRMCLPDASSDAPLTQEQETCLAELDQCDIKHSLDTISNQREASVTELQTRMP